MKNAQNVFYKPMIGIATYLGSAALIFIGQSIWF